MIFVIMSKDNDLKDVKQPIEHEFKSTKESRLFRKFQKKWKEYFPEPEHEEEEEGEDVTVAVQKIPELRTVVTEDIKIEKKILDYKSKKYVKTEA